MLRMTRKKDQYPCRIAGGCPAEEWIEEVTGINCYDHCFAEKMCSNCPFEAYINRLAELEDELEN